MFEIRKTTSLTVSFNTIIQAIMQMSVLAVFLCVQSANALEINLYGVGHLSADSVDDGDDSSFHLASSSSRLGLKGHQALTGDLTVIFQFESGVDLTAQGVNDGNGGADSEGQIFTKGRPSFIGLKGSFGQVLIGHQPALDQWANDYNLFADQVGDLGNLWEGSGLPGRLDNIIQYTTPDYNGFNVAASYAPEEGIDDTDILILKSNYATGGLKLGLAYIDVGQGANTDEHTALALTVSYHFDRFSIGGGYQNESDILGVSGDDRDSFSIGASVNVGENGVFKAQYAVSNGDGADTDANQFAIGYDYALGEQTTLYVAYAHMENDTNVNFSANGKGHGDKVVPAFGDDPSAFSLGIVYKFDVNLYK